MASSIYQSYVARHPTRVRDVTNVEFVAKKLDEAMDNHDHDGVNSPLIDTSVTLDFNAGGGTIYVRTPGSTSDDEEFPPVGDLQNVYTRAEVDQRLNNKSDVAHKHAKADVLDFPEAMKNPHPLVINGDIYDGSSEMNLTLPTVDLIGGLEEFGATFNEILKTKANSQHSHVIEDIIDLMDMIYPVGIIYLSTSPLNPTDYFGGTWEPWGSGRVPVGVDPSQTEFDSVEKTGGTKEHTLGIQEMPEHAHSFIVHDPIIPSSQMSTDGAILYDLTNIPKVPGVFEMTEDHGGGLPHNNLQPYVTCYMWKRIA